MEIVFLSSFLFINCSLLCDVILAASWNFLFYQLFCLTSSYAGEWSVAFICCQRPVIFSSFRDSIPVSLCSFVLPLNFLPVLRVYFSKQLSQFTSETTKVSIIPSFVLNCPLKSFAFIKTVANLCCKPTVAFNPISIGHNYYGKPILQKIYYKTFMVIYIFSFSSRIFYKRINKFLESFSRVFTLDKNIYQRNKNKIIESSPFSASIVASTTRC